MKRPSKIKNNSRKNTEHFFAFLWLVSNKRNTHQLKKLTKFIYFDRHKDNAAHSDKKGFTDAIA
jgi:hypothetical protein